MIGYSRSGVSLIDSVVALAVTGLVLAGSARGLLTATTVTRTADRRMRALTLARNTMENALGAACAPPYSCAPGFVCRNRRQETGVAGLTRLTVTVETDRGQPSPQGHAITASPATLAELSTLVPTIAPCQSPQPP